MTHTSTEQPEALQIAAWLRKSNDEAMAWREDGAAAIERLHARILELEAQTAHMADLVEIANYATKKLEAAQAQRVPLSDEAERHIKDLTEIGRMPNAEYVADAHNNAVRYLRGITQENQG